MYWKKRSDAEIKDTIFNALAKNINVRREPVLGLPGTYLDTEEFYEDAPFLKDAPFMTALIENPNHIGCHTVTSSVEVFKGTQAIEIELIKLCAEQIFGGEPDMQDGYVAPGGTEANIEAMWIYRNYFQQEMGASPDEIAVVYSEDSHYSMPKGANLLGLRSVILKVDQENREILQDEFETAIKVAWQQGVKYFIVVMNVSTTMFGSVDDIDRITDYLNSAGIPYFMHVDAAFGGFIYPFVNEESPFTFKNPNITSFTIDGHKMLQAPYGTGIFLIRKNFMQYVCTKEAQYIPGKDYTLCGSRSGANAISVWMIMMVHGSDGWKAKMRQLVDSTSNVCDRLNEMGVEYFRNPYLNIITIKGEYVSKKLAAKYHLVADSYESETRWWKIVMMPHVRRGIIDSFITDLKAERSMLSSEAI